MKKMMAEVIEIIEEGDYQKVEKLFDKYKDLNPVYMEFIRIMLEIGENNHIYRTENKIPYKTKKN